MPDMPVKLHDYQHPLFDSTRWNSFATRPDDIIVCTSYKAGTTWTQMICALLVHQTPDLPRPLAELSPWLDLRIAPIEEIKQLHDTQSWRRVVKTHTPLDGLNYRQDVSYIICGRDPRDVFLSMQGHLENINMEVVGQALAAQGIPLEPPPPMPEDVSERFKIWMQASSFDWEQDGVPLWSHFRHAQTFWEFRHLPNMLFLHYADLKTDLEGQMRRVAKFLDVDVPEERWPVLVKAATFEDMKANADSRAPDTNFGVYHSNDQFFKRGTNRQWEGVLSPESLALYEDTFRSRYGDELVDWLEKGSLATGYPEER